MSVYEWPADAEDESRDDPYARQRFIAPRRRQLDLEQALLAGRMTAPRGARRARDRARRMGIVFGQPTGLRNLWLPLGPTTIIRGQAANKPRVSGRVRALAVHRDGERLYAAAGNGGIWYSKDAGASWQSIGGLASTDTSGITRPAHRHACGAILVKFDEAAPNDESKDLVFVGTGETIPDALAEPGSNLAGVGIFVATGPATSAAADPWTREAPNLAGRGVFRFAAEPGGSRVVVATSIGLFERPSAPGVNVPWTKFAAKPFDTFEGVCTDVLWTAAAGGAPARLWVWATGKKPGLWVQDGGSGDFAPVATPAFTNARSVLAASEPPTRVYVLNNRDFESLLPGLYRIDNSSAAAPTAKRVTAGVPDVLGDQGEYDMTMAVDPSNPDRVVIAGKHIPAVNPAGKRYESVNGSITAAVVADNAGTLTFGHPTAPTMIGVGVHADVHDLRFSKAGARLWTSCDGGVFRSDKPTQQVGFVACNDGLSIAEANFVASHPTCEGRVVLGLQDNGVIERDSNGVWRVAQLGDGGGVAFDPSDPTRYLSQYAQADWKDSTGGFGKVLERGGTPVAPHHDDENEDSAFYSTPAAIEHQRGATVVGQVLVGTDRLWYTEDWGTTFFTLPTASDPIAAATYNRTQDVLGADESITVCKWASPDVAWVLTAQRSSGRGRRILRFQRTPGTADVKGPGTWAKPPESILQQSRKNKKDATKADGPIRDAVAWTDIAVNLDANGAQRGTKGALYLGTAGHPDKGDVDTLWWFDGTEKWHKTNLRTEGVAAPVTAVLCDPANPDHVYVGTMVGVWRGTRTLAANNPPDWVWEPLVNGLPEAAVEDLSLFDHGGLRLLRAAIASRGVWELAIDTDVVERTYLRMHDDDLRWRDKASEIKRDGNGGRSWHGSPDVRPRPAPGPVAKPATLPWTSTTGDIVEETLWRFQVALRAKTNDPRCRPTGRWDLYFEEVMRDNGAPQAGNICSITSTFWDDVMKAPHVNAEPWGTATPTEADLHELAPKLEEGDGSRVSADLLTGKVKVDVVVHHRGIGTVGGSDVRVTLLHWIDPKAKKKANPDDPATWFDQDVPWAAAVNDVLNSSGGTTSKTFGNGWAFTLPGPVRRKTLPGQTLDALHSGVVTFDINLAGAKADFVLLLVAVIRAGSDTALAPAKLPVLVRDNPNVAVRSVRIYK